MPDFAQDGYHLYADLAAGAGATGLALLMANPTLAATACPTPAADEQFVIRSIYVSVGGDVAFQLDTDAGAIYKLDLPGGGIGDLVMGWGLPCGAGKVPRLTLGTAVACKLHVFATLEKISAAGAGVC